MRRLLLFSAVAVLLLSLNITNKQQSTLSAISGFRLPAQPGTKLLIRQGNNGAYSHTGTAEYAFDFVLPEGGAFTITSAQGGTVIAYNDQSSTVCDKLYHEQNTPPDKTFNKCWAHGNFILIANDDGQTAALYEHLAHGSVKVHLHDHVTQGTPLAVTGTTGFSTEVHLHFQVENCSLLANWKVDCKNPPDPQLDPYTGWWFQQSIPIAFSNPEVLAQDADGVPRTDQKFLVSTNSPSSSQTVPMPHTETSCPASGTARATITAPLALGTHQNVVYLDGRDTEHVNPTVYGSLKRYDMTTGKTTEVVHQTPASITESSVSADGQWVLFVSQVSGQAAIQMIRMDGQGLQTLYCAPAGQSIGSLSWSPDQKSLVFNEQATSVTAPPATYLLDIAKGTLGLLLTQPKFTSIFGGSVYVPLDWIDNARLYMREFISALDNPTRGLYLLDTAKGMQQTARNLLLVANSPTSSYNGIAVSPNGKNLFLSKCSCAFQGGSGPSSITVQPTSGGTPQTMYTNPTAAILGIYMLSDKRLLLLVESYTESSNVSVDKSQNGLWTINTDGTGLKRISTQKETEYIFLNDSMQYPWANISRDGSNYVALVRTCAGSGSCTNTLVIGSMSGNTSTATVTIETAPNVLDEPWKVLGWTTM